MTGLVFAIVTFIVIFIAVYRKNSGENVYKYIITQSSLAYDKLAPYSFKEVRSKVQGLGEDYSKKQYTMQVAVFAIGAFMIGYLYFYSIIVALIYSFVAISFIPYLSYLRYKRVYSEFIFEQIQVYTTNTIMEFTTTQSFVKALEGVYESGILEDPVRADVKSMIDMAYDNGTVEQSIDFFYEKYPFHIVKNMHQLFTQITNEGSTDASEPLETMSNDIDVLVEGVYRDRLDRAQFQKKFLQFGIVLYFMVMLIQVLLGVETYIEAIELWYIQALLHGIILINTYFLISGEKYYNENVGAE